MTAGPERPTGRERPTRPERPGGAERRNGWRAGAPLVPAAGKPTLSIVVPVYRAPDVLRASLGALAASDLPREQWELIVVNDGFDPDTYGVAMRYADAVVRLPGRPRGPSYARNRGVEVAAGDVLVFIDSDVCVHPTTLRRFRDLFAEDPELAAAFGSYDDRPPAPGVVSRYRNLLHHHVHQTGAGEAETFWAGCGAIRAEVFEAVGGYDEWHFGRPQVEDIELGRRVRRADGRIVLRPDILVTHLKRWGFWEILVTDLKHRGMAWTRLLLHEGRSEAYTALNLSPRHRACAILVGLACVAMLCAVVLWSPWPLLAAALAVLGVASFNWPFYRLVARRAGWWTPVAAVPLHFLHYLSNGLAALGGLVAYTLVGAPQPPPAVAAFREIGVETWPPVPSRPKESVWYRHAGLRNLATGGTRPSRPPASGSDESAARSGRGGSREQGGS